jgi:hypothetical protein
MAALKTTARSNYRNKSSIRRASWITRRSSMPPDLWVSGDQRQSLVDFVEPAIRRRWIIRSDEISNGGYV